jgi:hypothetical protein
MPPPPADRPPPQNSELCRVTAGHRPAREHRLPHATRWPRDGIYAPGICLEASVTHSTNEEADAMDAGQR